jgi:hypothetical protein
LTILSITDFACLPCTSTVQGLPAGRECEFRNFWIMHDDISIKQFVIPGLTRNPVFSWIPAFAGMTPFAAINVIGNRTLKAFL